VDVPATGAAVNEIANLAIKMHVLLHEVDGPCGTARLSRESIQHAAYGKAALRVAHGAEQVQNNVSFYYLADEVAGTSRGMEIAIPARHWNGRFADLSPEQLASQLKQIAGHAQLRRYRKHPRGPKKPSLKRRGTAPHVSTARLIARRRE